MIDMNLRRLGVMLDCSRNAVMKPSTVKRYIDILSSLGYNTLMLYTEDTYQIENEPYFGHLRGRYSKEELKDIDNYAKQNGIELIPCIQTLAHLERIFRWREYGGIRDCNDILLADDDKTYALIDNMFKSLAGSFTSRTVNIGMDEAHMLGRGKYLDKNGLKDRLEIIMSHLNKVAQIAEKYDFKICMWGDMFLGGDLFVRMMSGQPYDESELREVEQRKALVPQNVEIIYWDYYSLDKKIYNQMLEVYSTICDNVWYAGGLWGWTGFAPHNKFSIDTANLAFTACQNHGVKDVFMTIWGDDGNECSKFSLLPSLYYVSRIAKGETDIGKIKQGFKEKFGIAFDDFCLLDLPFTPNGTDGKTYNSDKYLLYNDCFNGLFDCITSKEIADGFNKNAQKLKGVGKGSKYEYLFDNIEKLCCALSIKADIGIRTREAYLQNDKDSLKVIIGDYGKLIIALEEFYKAFKKQWFIENKPFGFEVQDIRIGGLIARVKHCKERLEEYLDGEIEQIEELNEPVLDIYCRKEVSDSGIIYNNWKNSVTTNII